MKVSRDLVKDLLPVYYSGEASAATKEFVESFFRSDPEFAQSVKQEWSEERLREGFPGTSVLAEETAALNRSRALVRRRSILMGVAIFSTCMVAATRFDGSGAHWIWSDFPAGAVVCAVVAAASWIGYLIVPNPLRR